MYVADPDASIVRLVGLLARHLPSVRADQSLWCDRSTGYSALLHEATTETRSPYLSLGDHVGPRSHCNPKPRRATFNTAVAILCYAPWALIRLRSGLVPTKAKAKLREKAHEQSDSAHLPRSTERHRNWSRHMSSVTVEHKSYEMPPREGISIAHFLTVTDIERSARYYEKVFGARILSLGDGNAPGYLQLANIWMILNVGGGPTPDKPTVTLSVPDPNHINSFMNFRVADIQACYKLWKSRGAEFITEPIPKYGETRCYIRDPDGYIIEVGQSKPDFTYG